MSKLLYKHKFINPKINTIADTEQQKNNLFKENNKFKLSEIELKENELIDIDNERVTKERITIINVDSRDRPLDPKNIYDKNRLTLRDDPIEFKVNTNKIIFFMENHPFKLNDKIAVNNVVGRQVKLRHRLFLYENSQYAKFIDENNIMTYEYNNKNLLLNLQNVKGNFIPNTNRTGTELNGLSINLFNRNHDILFNLLSEDIVGDPAAPSLTSDPMAFDDDVCNLNKDIKFIQELDINLLEDLDALQVYLNDNLINGLNPLDNTVTNIQDIINRLTPIFYLIKLPKDSTSDYKPDRTNGTDIENSCIKISFKHIFGVPLNQLNADYPLSIDRRFSNHIISRIIDNNKFEVCIRTNIIPPKDTDDPNNLLAGGKCIEMAKILNIFDGYPDANHYKVFLNRTFYNVKRVELISSIFPKTEKVFKSSPPIKQNNKIYWNLLRDGDEEYSIEITPGNFTPEALIIELESKFSMVERVTYEDRKMQIVPSIFLSLLTFPNVEFIDLSKTNIIKVTINIYTDNVSFFAFDQIFMKENIGDFSSIDSTFTIVHPFHPYNLEDVGNVTILISGSTDINDGFTTFSSESINGEHTIVEIIDEHRYKVSHDRIVLPITISPNYGGDNVSIIFPIKFRLLFNKPDTMGKEIGFNKVGLNNSITEFNYELSNFDLYDEEVNFNNLGIEFNRKNSVLLLDGPQYILMTNQILGNFVNTGKVSDIFAKIQLENENDDNIIYNSFVTSPKIFDDPLSSMSELEFKFYTHDNNLYDFNGVDHSFCLRIIELVNIPKDSHINSRTGGKLQTYSNVDVFV